MPLNCWYAFFSGGKLLKNRMKEDEYELYFTPRLSAVVVRPTDVSCNHWSLLYVSCLSQCWMLTFLIIGFHIISVAICHRIGIVHDCTTYSHTPRLLMFCSQGDQLPEICFACLGGWMSRSVQDEDRLQLQVCTFGMWGCMVRRFILPYLEIFFRVVSFDLSSTFVTTRSRFASE